MAWIEVIDENDADEPLRSLYARLIEDGCVDNILKIHSLHPASLESHLAVYKNCMFGSGPLTRSEREMTAVVVSQANGCHY